MKRKVKIIAHLLEPDLKRGVEDGDEGDGLLARALRDVEEEGLVLSGEELLLGGRVGREEGLDVRERVIERGERLKD